MPIATATQAQFITANKNLITLQKELQLYAQGSAHGTPVVQGYLPVADLEALVGATLTALAPLAAAGGG